MRRALQLYLTRVLAVLALVTSMSAGALAWAPRGFAAETPVQIPSDRETVPGAHTGDTIDDPAIWVNPSDPSRSLVIANDKAGELDTYDLDGSVVQRININNTFWGNVDVLQNVTIGDTTRDLIGVVQKQGARFYTVDPATRLLSAVTEGGDPVGVAGGEGFCMYQSAATHKVYGISIAKNADTVNEFELLDADGDGLLESKTVRTFNVGSEAEGCVADDDTGALYISQEDVALWRYGAEPDAGTTREAVDVLTGSGGHLANDIEGVTLVDQPDGHGYLIASAQNVANPNSSYFGVYRRETGNDFVNTFRIVDGATSDDCDRTDGVAATTADLGPAFPRGLFVCQDNNNNTPGMSGNQDLKLVSLDKVVDLDGTGPPPPPPPPPPGPLQFVGQSSFNANQKSFSVKVPAPVQTGDALLLFASQGGTSTMTGPGTGWTQIGRTTDGTHATTIWQKTATDTDLGSTVKLTTAAGAYLKAGLTLAAYRGVDPTDPIAAISGAPEPGNATAHTTPVVTDTTEDAWRVSYWSDKNNATTSWTAPPDETRRATTTGAGSGRVDTLLTDSNTPVPTGSQGGLTATSNAAASTATAWTLLLRPAEDSSPPPGNQPPTARFTYTCDAFVCDFDGSQSSDDEDGAAVRYSWDFGDGGTSDEAEPTHDFGSSGSRQVTLTVTDSGDATDSDTQTVAVGDGSGFAAISFVGQSSFNANQKSFSVKVPAPVQTGDALLLFASQGGTSTMTGPGTGWTQIGRTTDGTHATTIWQKTATDTDLGSTVKLTTAAGAYLKAGLTLAAYRGVDPTDPIAAISGAPEPGNATAHTTPVVTDTTEDAWRVSYWSDKNNATTSWTAPPDETRRATTTGAGSGRVDTLLTDSNTPVPTGSQGGLTATSNAAASTATAWTLLLRPGPTP